MLKKGVALKHKYAKSIGVTMAALVVASAATRAADVRSPRWPMAITNVSVRFAEIVLVSKGVLTRRRRAMLSAISPVGEPRTKASLDFQVRATFCVLNLANSGER